MESWSPYYQQRPNNHYQCHLWIGSTKWSASAWVRSREKQAQQSSKAYQVRLQELNRFYKQTNPLTKGLWIGVGYNLHHRPFGIGFTIQEGPEQVIQLTFIWNKAMIIEQGPKQQDNMNATAEHCSEATFFFCRCMFFEWIAFHQYPGIEHHIIFCGRVSARALSSMCYCHGKRAMDGATNGAPLPNRRNKQQRKEKKNDLCLLRMSRLIYKILLLRIKYI